MSKHKPLKCTQRGCKALQTADGEFCGKHYPKGKATDGEWDDVDNRPLYENKVDMADLCGLAHEFTERECKLKHIKMQDKKNDGSLYTIKAEKIFNYYYDTITDILGV